MGTPAAAPQASSFMAQLQIPPQIQQVLASAPKAYNEEVLLVDNQNMRVCYNMSLGSPKTKAVLFIVNKTSGALDNVVVTAQGVQSLQCGFTTNSSVPQTQLRNASTIAFQPIPAGSTAACLLNVDVFQLQILSR